MWSDSNNAALVLLCLVLAISLIVIFFLICAIKSNKCDGFNSKYTYSHSSQYNTIHSVLLFIVVCVFFIQQWLLCKQTAGVQKLNR